MYQLNRTIIKKRQKQCSNPALLSFFKSIIMAKLLVSDIYLPNNVILHDDGDKMITFDIKMSFVSSGDFSKYVKENNKIDKNKIAEDIFNGKLEMQFK